jgi:hypothetical protein
MINLRQRLTWMDKKQSIIYKPNYHMNFLRTGINCSIQPISAHPETLLSTSGRLMLVRFKTESCVSCSEIVTALPTAALLPLRFPRPGTARLNSGHMFPIEYYLP